MNQFTFTATDGQDSTKITVFGNNEEEARKVAQSQAEAYGMTIVD